jgi:hypothetical protein
MCAQLRLQEAAYLVFSRKNTLLSIAAAQSLGVSTILAAMRLH